MKKALVLSLVCFVFLGLNNAFAGFPGVGDMLGGNKSGGSGVSVSDLSSAKDKAVKAYFASTQELLQSFDKAGEAFGKKKEVMQLTASARDIGKSTLKSEDQDKKVQVSTAAADIIKQEMEKTTTPSIECKKLMAESMVHLVSAMQLEKEQVVAVKDLSSQAQSAVSSASPMEIIKVKDIASTALTLTKALPGDLKMSKDILSIYIKYATAHGISIPSQGPGLLEGKGD